jgi:hypothetical protein
MSREVNGSPPPVIALTKLFPGLMEKKLVPKEVSSLEINATVPCPTEEISITAVIPMIIPSIVKDDLRALVFRALIADFRISLNSIIGNLTVD